MKIIVGTEREQIELSGVKWIIVDELDLHLTTDGDRAVIEEVDKSEKCDL